MDQHSKSLFDQLYEYLLYEINDGCVNAYIAWVLIIRLVLNRCAISNLGFGFYNPFVFIS